MQLSKMQRAVLWVAAAVGLFGINGLFLYTILMHPEQMAEAHTNGYAMTFIVEAFVLLPVLCFLISVVKLRSPGWKGFLLLSILGSLAFSIPFSVLLWSRSAQKATRGP